MSLEPKPIMSALTSVALKTGLFRRVNKFEARGQPPNGLTLELIAGPVTPAPSSGLNRVTLRWQVDGRIYVPMNMDPPEDIDFHLTRAAAGYMEALCGAFTLGGLVRCIDVFGAEGAEMSCTPGYIEHNDKFYRMAQLVIPLLINDRWELTG